MSTQKIPFKDRIIPWYFVLFFVILAIVNIIFVTLATNSHPGVVQENAYETGLNYNDIITASEEQSRLGWQTDLQITNEKIIVLVKDNNNQPIDKADVKILVESVLKKKQEILLTLPESQAGRYSIPISFPHKGRWDITVAVSNGSKMTQAKTRHIVQ